jgi:hypothetical protein
MEAEANGMPGARASMAMKVHRKMWARGEGLGHADGNETKEGHAPLGVGTYSGGGIRGVVEGRALGVAAKKRGIGEQWHRRAVASTSGGISWMGIEGGRQKSPHGGGVCLRCCRRHCCLLSARARGSHRRSTRAPPLCLARLVAKGGRAKRESMSLLLASAMAAQNTGSVGASGRRRGAARFPCIELWVPLATIDFGIPS